MLQTCALILSVIFVVNVHSKKIPEYIHVCHQSDPDLNACIKNSIEDLRPELKKGVPELGVPSIEPLIIEELIATQGTGLTVTTKDIKAYGGGNFTIKNLHVDIVNHKYDFVLGFDHLRLEGKYDVDGKIIMIMIKGTGDMEADVYNVEGAVTMASEEIVKDGIRQIRFTEMSVDAKVGNGKILLSNLFGGDKLIGDTINAAINLNFQYFVNELKPIISDTIKTFILKSANNIVDGLSYDELLPP
ncbi:hypothetical protein O3M35_010675 [Rhynocoris fuscipes]|uniref:Uncharacterized protein n=1 Tax=Rhynocoris fuscipes TaxID=488301 RepID=A0AAW1D3I1_9HEMI